MWGMGCRGIDGDRDMERRGYCCLGERGGLEWVGDGGKLF